MGDAPVRIPLASLPFRIGRSTDLDLVLSSPRVSKRHAEIDADGRGYLLRDLGSRNGTFVNGERVKGERPLAAGDVVHIAHRELELVDADGDEGVSDSTLAGEEGGVDVEYYRRTRDLYRILSGRTVRAVFQSIVSLSESRTVGYEALGRNTLPSVTYDATTLFGLASERGRAVELSRIMRSAALADAPALPVGDRIFMNVHPAEMLADGLLDELERAADVLAPHRRLVAEIHEAAIVDHATMRTLRDELNRRNIELAYDDFGAGRARLMELAEVPPDFLKLDMALVRDIDTSPNRQELVAALLGVMREVGVRVIAEGIETNEELRVCRELGCELGQGFLIRHPAPAVDLRDTMP